MLVELTRRVGTKAWVCGPGLVVTCLLMVTHMKFHLCDEFAPGTWCHCYRDDDGDDDDDYYYYYHYYYDYDYDDDDGDYYYYHHYYYDDDCDYDDDDGDDDYYYYHHYYYYDDDYDYDYDYDGDDDDDDEHDDDDDDDDEDDYTGMCCDRYMQFSGFCCWSFIFKDEFTYPPGNEKTYPTLSGKPEKHRLKSAFKRGL